jgi:molybdopterin converting factor small subunit
MVTLKVPTPLRTYTNGLTEIAVQGGTVGAAMHDLVIQHPALRPHLFNGQAELRPFVNLFLNNENIKDLKGLETPLNEGDRILLIPSIAGGSDQCSGVPVSSSLTCHWNIGHLNT